MRVHFAGSIFGGISMKGWIREAIDYPNPKPDSMKFDSLKNPLEAHIPKKYKNHHAAVFLKPSGIPLNASGLAIWVPVAGYRARVHL